MPNEIRGRLDNAIDRAVRGMMQVDPLPGLRHRVADRLEAPARRSWAIPAFATAAAMVVLIVAFALLRDPAAQPPGVPRITTISPVAPVLPPPSAEVQTAAEPQGVVPVTATPERLRPRTSGSIFGSRTGRVSAANLTGEPVPGNIGTPVVEAAVEPPPPPPGALAPLAPITIVPIAVTPIQIQPLTLNPVRDQR